MTQDQLEKAIYKALARHQIKKKYITGLVNYIINDPRHIQLILGQPLTLTNIDSIAEDYAKIIKIISQDYVRLEDAYSRHCHHHGCDDLGFWRFYWQYSMFSWMDHSRWGYGYRHSAPSHHHRSNEKNEGSGMAAVVIGVALIFAVIFILSVPWVWYKYVNGKNKYDLNENIDYKSRQIAYISAWFLGSSLLLFTAGMCATAGLLAAGAVTPWLFGCAVAFLLVSVCTVISYINERHLVNEIRNSVNTTGVYDAVNNATVFSQGNNACGQDASSAHDYGTNGPPPAYEENPSSNVVYGTATGVGGTHFTYSTNRSGAKQ